eukprot:104214-Pelagomonas_calceolata.AAC.1
MEPGASNDPPNPHQNLLFVAPWWRGKERSTLTVRPHALRKEYPFPSLPLRKEPPTGSHR